MFLKRKTLFYVVAALVFLLIIYFAYTYRQKIGKIVTPFLIALVVAYLVSPIVTKLEARKVSRRIGILLVYLGFSLLVIAIIIFLMPELMNNTKELINTLPDITTRYQKMANDFLDMINSSNWPPEIKNAILRELQNGFTMMENLAIDTLKKSLMMLIGTLTTIFDLVLAMIIAYYLIKDSELFKSLVLSLTPHRWRNGITAAGREINAILANFIQGQLITAVIIGTLETIGLSLVRIKYPIVLGAIGGLANIIPYFGPIIGAIPAVAVALIQSPIKALWTALVFIIVQQIDNAFISSKIIEGKVGLHPMTTILVVLIGGEFFGILGMFVAVPVAAILKVIIRRAIDAIV